MSLLLNQRIEMRSRLAELVEDGPVSAKKAIGEKIRVGIVGAGLMGRWHAQAARNAGGRVVAIADRDIRIAARLVSKFSHAEDFGSLEEMINRKSLDVLHVCTPLSSHRTIAESAIKAGINLMVEKPLAQTASETIRLYGLASDFNVQLCPVHQFAFQPGVVKARKLLPRIGKIVHMHVNICSAGGEGFAADQLNVIALDILPHPLSLFQTVLNTPLSDENWEVSRPRDGELRVEGYDSDTSFSIFISMTARPTNNFLKLFGTMGTISVDLFHGFAVIENGKVSKMRKILHPFDLAIRSFSGATMNLMRRAVQYEVAYPGLRQLVGAFYKSLREGTEPAITPSQAINVAKIRDVLITRSQITKREQIESCGSR